MNPQDPRLVVRELAILYNLQTLRQRRQIYDWTKLVPDAHVFVKLAAELQRMIGVLNSFDAKLQYFADFIYRQETEPAVQRAEAEHRAAGDLVTLDRMAAGEWLQRTVGTIMSVQRKRKAAGQDPDWDRIADTLDDDI